jgi:hypothetical protein
VSPILAEIAERMARRMTIIEDTPKLIVARIEDTGLIAAVSNCDPDNAVTAAHHLRQLQNGDESLTVCIRCDCTNADDQYARTATAKLLTDMGVSSIFGSTDADLLQQFEQLQRQP